MSCSKSITWTQKESQTIVRASFFSGGRTGAIVTGTRCYLFIGKRCLSGSFLRVVIHPGPAFRSLTLHVYVSFPVKKKNHKVWKWVNKVQSFIKHSKTCSIICKSQGQNTDLVTKSYFIQLLIILIYGDVLALMKEEQFRAVSSRSFQRYAYSDYSTYSENWKLA